MPLFQNAVLNKYLSGVDEKKIEEAWGKFTGHFHNREIQENIRNSKEEEYQEGFLNDLFVKVLGYTKNPSPDFNLKVEQKNLTDSKKADGALLDGNKVRGVIELKGTETTDLGKVETQAFGYKNKQPDAVYVIISNFEKLRFYIDNAVDFIEFNLFTLTKEEFKILWLCLGYSSFTKGLPKKIKDASLTEEENVTKKLYKDYSDFKHDVFESIKKHNPEYDKLLLFKKTQKLLDRFLFIFFAEDQLLLPPNSIRKIIEQWMDLRDKYDEYVPLYERFKKYFGYMNEGHKGKDHEIFAYNGGLFADDEVLDNLKIDDELLYKHTLQLSNYDFGSEVDVNILGHIFEHSLNEIEEITAELEGQEVDTSKTRRKKDGVFYTPKYITKYIVENTVGKLCEEQKAELEIEDEDYRPNRQKKTKKELLGKLDNYREWLLELTICDPACGSGAFLNQALEFLIEEHTYVDELQAKLLDQPLVIPDIENQILENNLFGVDINEESVEIAKLSLWLRTAQKGRKLTSLNNHIKCGNSLIDDPEVAGDKAFKWEVEFPNVFRQKEKQAFHVTWVTHNARTSQRMIEYKVKKGETIWLDKELEIMVANELAAIITEDELNVLNWNICGDHVHMLLVCDPEELANIVRKLKGRSAQKMKEYLKVPKEEVFHLWAQKFNRKPIEDEDGLANVFEYIQHNREKHNLPPSDKGLQPLVQQVCCSYEEAFLPEYTGGFDVVIGNPPYGATLSDLDKAFLVENYITFEYQVNTYVLFYERGVNIVKPRGILGYITPSTFTYQHYFKKIRSFIQQFKHIVISSYLYEVFDDADIGNSVSWVIQKEANDKSEILLQICKNKEEALKFPTSEDYDEIVNSDQCYNLLDSRISFAKLEKSSKKLVDIAKITAGIKPYQKGKGKPKQTSEDVKEKKFTSDKRVDNTYIQCINGGDFYRYGFLNEPGMYLSYGDWLAEVRRSAPFFDDEKIILRQTSDSLIGHIDDKQRINLNNVYNVGKKNDDFEIKYILALLNSKLMNLIYQKVAQEKGRTFAEVKKVNLSKLPIKSIPKSEQKVLTEKVDNIISQKESLFKVHNAFLGLIQSKFDIEKLSRKLESWHELTFKEFLKELKKKKVELSLSEEAEWMEYFNEQKSKADELKTKIAQTDSEIDAMVYELYGLSEEEIKIVEGK